MNGSSSFVGTPLPKAPELVYRPTVDLEAQEDEWFGVMNNVPGQCVPRDAPWQPLTNSYLAVLRSESANAETRARLLQLVERAVVFRTLPLAELKCTEEAARQVVTLPGVEFVVPALEGTPRTRSIAIGLDWLATVGELQQAVHLNDSVFGGRTPGQPPGYPVLGHDGDRLIIDADPNVEWPTEPAIMPVINMSLGTKPVDYPFLRNDIVNLATYGVGVRGSQLLVVSAGNCGTFRTGRETLSAWAQAPWVLSVGATADPEGRVLAEYSGRGAPDKPDSGPDLVAWGKSDIAPHPEGTSFAAPRVTFSAMLCAAALLQLRHAVQVASGKVVEGIRLVGCGFVDSWGKSIWNGQPRVPVPALPAIGVRSDELAALLRFCEEHGLELNVRGTAAVLRSLLIAAARPMAGYEKHEVGAGFLSVPIMSRFLAELSGADMLRMFASEEVPSNVLSEASRWHVFDGRRLETLVRVVAATRPEWRYDWRRQRYAARPAVGESLDTISEEQRTYGLEINWPLPIA
jgi:hypothetical protein